MSNEQPKTKADAGPKPGAASGGQRPDQPLKQISDTQNDAADEAEYRTREEAEQSLPKGKA